MNVNNFIVRPKRRLVEKYASAEAWNISTPTRMRSWSHGSRGLADGA